ncbi:phytanoyl-CoA dioxygenase family protein [Granulosicoccus antarcticus]|nr:phytanoyl-CoA dioxygenase family protein [Granulosicoccus antarcticus]
MSTLTSQQKSDYERDGFILVEDAVPPNVLSHLQSVTRDLVEQSRSVTQNNDVYDLDKGHSKDNPRINRIKTPHNVHAAYKEYLRSDALLELVQPLLGEHIRMNNSKLNTKAAQGGAPVEWHQDWSFYPHTNDDLLAIGIMLSDIGEEDGPLQMIPGSHKEPILSHFNDGVFCGAINPNDPAARLKDAVSITGKAGSLSIHHVRTTHGSAPNLGNNPRLLLLYELAAADAWPIGGALSVFVGMSQQELWDYFNDNMVCGVQSVTPRLRDVPVLMPLPPPKDASSIFQTQSSGGAKSAFATS